MATNDTCLEKHGLAGLEGATNFSNDQISYYCLLFAEYDDFYHSIYFALGLSMAITGAVGLVTNVLTFVTFSNGSDFVGPSFLYHKAMALMELLHMAILLQSGLLVSVHFPDSKTYWLVWWRDAAWGGWVIGNGAKMTVNCLVMFVSLERMIGVWLPLRFDMINRNRVAITAIVISILVGSLNLSTFAASYVTSRGNVHYIAPTAFGNNIAYLRILKAINVIRLCSGAITFALCVLVALGMYWANKRAAKMSSSAKERWKVMKMGCYLQLVLGITTVIAHIVSVWFQVVDQQQPYPHVGRMAMLLLDSFDEALANLPRTRYARSLEMAAAVFTCLDHGGRFFFYFVFHTTFRSNFKKDVWNRFRKTRVQALAGNG